MLRCCAGSEVEIWEDQRKSVSECCLIAWFCAQGVGDDSMDDRFWPWVMQMSGMSGMSGSAPWIWAAQKPAQDIRVAEKNMRKLCEN